MAQKVRHAVLVYAVLFYQPLNPAEGFGGRGGRRRADVTLRRAHSGATVLLPSTRLSAPAARGLARDEHSVLVYSV